MSHSVSSAYSYRELLLIEAKHYDITLYGNVLLEKQQNGSD